MGTLYSENPGQERQERADNFTAAHATYEDLFIELGQSVHMTEINKNGIIGALATGGHVLIDGTWGIGKTTTARAIATMIDGTAGRIQGDPDAVPSDFTGKEIFMPNTQEFVFRPGPLFANIVHIDEGHRFSVKAQAGFIEPLEEGQVTVSGTTHELPKPQVGIVTVNPGGGLAPVILDRLDIYMQLPAQDAAFRAKVLELKKRGHKTEKVATNEAIANLQKVTANGVEISSEQEGMANNIITRAYEDKRVDPDESIVGTYRHFDGLMKLAKFFALARGESGSRIVKPEDIAMAAPYVLGHRIVPTYAALDKKVTTNTIVADAVQAELNAAERRQSTQQ